MKKIISMILIGTLAFSLAACGSDTTDKTGDTTGAKSQEETIKEETSRSTGTDLASSSSSLEDTSSSSESYTELPETVIINGLDAEKNPVEVEVPTYPERIAVMDLAALDMLDSFDMREFVVGVSKGTSIDYLQSYMDDDSIANLGTIKETDMEAVMSCEPDVIFIGGRLSAQYDELSKIAPVVYLGTDTEIGLLESVRGNAKAIASMYGLEDEVDMEIADYESRIARLAEKAEGKTAVVGICTNGGFSTLGNDGRCSIIGTLIGFENLADGDVTATHGNESSFELLVELNPDYIFIMDRDSAINAEGAQLAEDIMDNELVHQTKAYQDGNVVFLENPAVWYTAEGGIRALDIMLTDLESAI